MFKASSSSPSSNAETADKATTTATFSTSENPSVSAATLPVANSNARKKNSRIPDLFHAETLRTSLLKDPLNLKKGTEVKMVGLKQYGLNPSTQKLRQEVSVVDSVRTLTGQDLGPTVNIETLEAKARRKTVMNPFTLLFLGNLAALKVMGYYLITLETILTCLLTVGLTLYWYFNYKDDPEWQGGGMDFILLAFAVTSPISAAIGMAYQRRERALIAISDFRSFSYHLYLAHAFWDWSPGGRAGANVDWLEHCDAVLAQLIGMGDELARFLSLPTTSRSRHRMTKSGRKEASRTTEVAYYLLESITTQRMTRLLLYSERLKKIGLPSGEVSRIRQYERFLSDIFEQLRMVKMYRSPQALRSFARIFTLLLPPFYAPTFAQVAMEVNSLGVGVAFAIITALGLTALFESLQVLEDPFTAFLALDGIDVREEFEVLHYAQLINTRRLAFPKAAPYPAARRAALTSRSKVISLGVPPPQMHHRGKSTATGMSEDLFHHAVAAAGVGSDKGRGGSTTEGCIVDNLPTIPMDEMQHDNVVNPPTEAQQKEEEEAEEEEVDLQGSESEPLLFSMDDMVHVDEELGMALESDQDASLARDSHFIVELEQGIELPFDAVEPGGRGEAAGSSSIVSSIGASHRRHRSRHLSRNSQSISRLFVGE